MFSIGIVIALVAAGWVYFDAKELGKGTNDALLWALGVFLLLIVFLPLYLVVGRKKDKKEKPDSDEHYIIDVEATEVEDVFNCPECLKEVQEDFKVCPYCGCSLKLQCKNCGAKLEQDWKVCPHCQEKI
ncbi:zinc ribbon domain-containing protein [Selenomonadales bacterium OttesenSCG-928-I06]|nr:zinc ribbon domain-containing protein [Selenomonadales bacterium OttesenSCG-928-I06]